MSSVALHDRLAEFLTLSVVLKSLALVVVLVVGKGVLYGYRVRKYFKDAARKHDAPMMPHSWFFGHIPILAKFGMKYPSDLYGQELPVLIANEYPDLAKHGALYVDPWPFANPMLAVFEPQMMTQYTQQKSLPKYDIHMQKEFKPLSNGEDLVNLEGGEWKHWRSVFNPVFSNANLMAAMADVFDEVEVFRGWLASVAKSGEVVQLFRGVTKLTLDLAGRIVLGTRLQCQTQPNAYADALKRQMTQLHIDNSPPMLMMAWSPLRPWRVMSNNRILRNYIKPLAEKALRQSPSDHKTIISTGAASFFRGESNKIPTSLPSSVVTTLKHHLTVFMFGGTDSVALTISKSYDYLYNNPRVRAALIDELDTVLGKDRSTAVAQLRANPALLNAMPYTLACVKETLRLSPPFGTVRKGTRGFFLTHPETGKQYPTEGMMLYGVSYVSQRDPKHWPRPTEYLPERWLAREGEELHVKKNLFRPFELGPRNCIGQEMALLEARATLALTVREFEIESVYADDAQTFLGEKAYQSRVFGDVAPVPKDGLPVRVKVRQ